MAAAGAAARVARAAEIAPVQAVAFIRESGHRLAALSGPGITPAERTTRLIALLDSVVDFDAIGQFCLGRYWRVASAGQRGAYLAAFRAVVTRNVVSRMGKYSSTPAKIEIGTPLRQGVDVNVPMTVLSAGSPLHLVWVVGEKGGQPKIVDLMAEGISLRVTQRSDYASYIDRHDGNVDALIAAIRRQQATTGPA